MKIGNGDSAYFRQNLEIIIGRIGQVDGPWMGRALRRLADVASPDHSQAKVARLTAEVERLSGIVRRISETTLEEDGDCEIEVREAYAMLSEIVNSCRAALADKKEADHG